ncbi:LysR family transcriptional regulator [Rhodococcus sp. HNM0569]|uniref:LysR family transcriptional regulator n=1 Tax=Rhodococcus sp. HNM0569 TaxID=2716340 RepID=UPI00146CE72C|nr:LysR family transcriptional regulator [Rhodococcus sp. HNM0569]NLU83401.1 LysR family transcriptional regulator [Rhodococcus sp. HNM0569]
MDLVRHLRFFVALAEEEHFGRAAHRLGMTQPPLSQGIRRLETRLGLTLVERTARGGVLTAAGRELLPRARLLVADADRFDEEAARIAGAHVGVLRWGATAALSDRLVLECVSRLAGSGPTATRVVTSCDTTPSLVDAVRGHALDLAVVEQPALLDGVRYGPVVRLPRWVVVPAGHPVCDAQQPRARMLDDLAFASAPRTDNPPAHDALVELWRARGLDPAVVATEDERAMLACVAAGQAFGVTTTRPQHAPGVQWIELLRDDVSLPVRVVWNADRPQPVHSAALDRVLTRARR